MDHAEGFGTFAFPDPSIGRDGYEAYLQRMWTATISERMLSNADFLYQEWREAEIDRRVAAELSARYAKGGDLYAAIEQFKVDSKGAWHADWIEAQIMKPATAEAQARIGNEVGPKWIGRSKLATVVRASQACVLTNLLPEPERQKVYDHRIAFGDEELSLKEIADRFNGFAWISEALVDSDVPVATMVSRAVSLIAESQRAV